MMRSAAKRLALGAALVLACAGIVPVCSLAQTAQKTTLADVTGPDDGFGLSLQSSGDFAASFEPCG